jgi:hypothetical protein
MPSPWPLCAGLFWILMALLCGWIGVLYPRTEGRAISVAASPSQWPRSMTPTQARFWLILWTVMGLSWVGVGVTIMRHAQGDYVVIPASAHSSTVRSGLSAGPASARGSACSSRGRGPSPPEPGENGARVASTPATHDGTSRCALRPAF